jgi:Na+/proline symporter
MRSFIPQLTLWTFLAIVALFSLIFFGRRKSVIWSWFGLGLLVGLLISAIAFLIQHSFSWSFIKKGAVLGILVGMAVEFYSRTNKKK